MKKISFAATTHVASTLVVSTLGLLAGAHGAGATSNGDLAFHYAPVHYQDTDSSDYPSEYITAFDYDSDRVSTNNWDNRGSGQWTTRGRVLFYCYRFQARGAAWAHAANLKR